MLTTTPLPQTILDAAAAVSVPREAPASSFVLHAPLELMARVGLLPYLDPDARAAAVDRISRLADEYTATGPAATAPATCDFASPSQAAAALATAIERGDLDEVDATMTWLT